LTGGDGDDEEEDDEVELHKESGTIDLESLTKPMVHPAMQKALTKQGYKLIGTHRYLLTESSFSVP
jgi:hypothetical protein